MSFFYQMPNLTASLAGVGKTDDCWWAMAGMLSFKNLSGGVAVWNCHFLPDARVFRLACRRKKNRWLLIGWGGHVLCIVYFSFAFGARWFDLPVSGLHWRCHQDGLVRHPCLGLRGAADGVGLVVGEGPLVAVGGEGPELVLEELGPGLGVLQDGQLHGVDLDVVVVVWLDLWEGTEGGGLDSGLAEGHDVTAHPLNAVGNVFPPVAWKKKLWKVSKMVNQKLIFQLNVLLTQQCWGCVFVFWPCMFLATQHFSFARKKNRYRFW